MRQVIDELTRLGKTLRVLVVDDNQTNRVLVHATLECYGIESVLVPDGEKAVELVEKGERFDIVFMDLHMPIMNGLDATQKIRSIEQQKSGKQTDRLPILAYTTGDFPADKVALQHHGFDATLPKPFAEDDLKRCIHEWCLKKTGTG